MYTEPIALTGYIHICIICREIHPYCLGIHSVGDHSTGSRCAAWLFNCQPVINQHRWETLPKWLPMNSLYMVSA